jgi:uncharacterized membrane protein
MTEKDHTPTPQTADNSLAIASMVLGVVSLTGPGLILGIPAIILAAIALKKKAAGRGLSIAGLVTGIISTVLSLLFIAFLIVMLIVSANTSDSDWSRDRDYPDSHWYEGSRT